MQNLIEQCYKRINDDEYSICSTPSGENCLECFSHMYWNGNEVNYECNNKRLIYIIRYFPVHSSEIYHALHSLFLKFHHEIKNKNELVLASFGGGPGIDTYSFHKLLNAHGGEFQCNSFSAFRIEACEEWTELARQVMFINTPQNYHRKYYRLIADVTSQDVTICEKFDVAVLSYIVSELSDTDINRLIKNILNNKKENSYILINDRNEDVVTKKIEKIMKAIASDDYSQNQFSENHCGFDFPLKIFDDMRPKVYRKSIYFTGKLK